MAQFTFQIPDAKATDLLNAFCHVNGYKDQVLDMQNGLYISNPETQTQFAKRVLREYYVSAYRQLKIATATEQAIIAVQGEVQ